ncbi:GNAT family N-acetyltransferase [Propylenella binzhouense]|uniref:N-acetyltransferase family protein n=1 Tax=Propylenella binzhouense TaxID=2555902 RepID=A0A964T897_9HYPH|nr:GNAT family N-acetyltransferase [Propylenella binzhouense]MYZ49682.1 N-acetyltransferase family protein [Propylenella binzhouense]
MPTAPALRPCEPGDVAAIAAIYRDAVLHGTASFEIDPPEPAEMARRRAALVEAGYPYLAAVAGGEIVGYAYAGPYRPRPAYRGTVENSVYVRGDSHGRGVGRLLLSAVIDAAAERGFRQMVAVIGDSANTASIRLHAALGFRHVGTLAAVGWKHGRWLDTVLMQRALGVGDGGPPDAR